MTMHPKRMAFQEQIVPAVFDVMQLHVSNATVLQHAMKTIVISWSDETFQTQAQKQDAVQTFAKAMRAHAQDSYIAWGLFSCVSRTVRGHVGNQDRARDVDLIEAMLHCVDTLKDCRAVLGVARIALQDLAEDNEANSAYILRVMTQKHAMALAHDGESSKMVGVTEAVRWLGWSESKAKVLARMVDALAAHKARGDIITKALAEYKKKQQASEEVCAACGKNTCELGTQMMKCSACIIAPVYCGVACQKAAWPAHRAECKANRK